MRPIYVLHHSPRGTMLTTIDRARILGADAMRTDDIALPIIQAIPHGRKRSEMGPTDAWSSHHMFVPCTAVVHAPISPFLAHALTPDLVLHYTPHGSVERIEGSDVEASAFTARAIAPDHQLHWNEDDDHLFRATSPFSRTMGAAWDPLEGYFDRQSPDAQSTLWAAAVGAGMLAHQAGVAPTQATTQPSQQGALRLALGTGDMAVAQYIATRAWRLHHAQRNTDGMLAPVAAHAVLKALTLKKRPYTGKARILIPGFGAAIALLPAEGQALGRQVAEMMMEGVGGTAQTRSQAADSARTRAEDTIARDARKATVVEMMAQIVERDKLSVSDSLNRPELDRHRMVSHHHRMAAQHLRERMERAAQEAVAQHCQRAPAPA